jgi:hypothetical protein
MRTAVLCCLASSLLTAAALVLLCLPQPKAAAQAGHPAKGWEYKLVTHELLAKHVDVLAPKDQREAAARETNLRFDKLGEDGWEFVGIYVGSAVFKRPRR